MYAEKPNSGIVSIHRDQVTLIDSTAVGGGTLYYGGRRYPFRLEEAGLGASSLDATGDVHDLCCLEDFDGVYGQLRTPWALDSQNKGEIWLQNSKGVYLHLKGRHQPLSLTLGADGMLVRLGA